MLQTPCMFIKENLNSHHKVNYEKKEKTAFIVTLLSGCNHSNHLSHLNAILEFSLCSSWCLSLVPVCSLPSAFCVVLLLNEEHCSC